MKRVTVRLVTQSQSLRSNTKELQWLEFWSSTYSPIYSLPKAPQKALNMSSIKPLILHAHGTGPNPYKIAAALELLHLPYDVKLWQFGDAENGVKGKVFTKINENGRVPALEDPNTGVTSWESGAVMNYIRRVYDKENKLGPRGNKEQDIVDFEKWEYFLLSTLGPMMGMTPFPEGDC